MFTTSIGYVHNHMYLSSFGLNVVGEGWADLYGYGYGQGYGYGYGYGYDYGYGYGYGYDYIVGKNLGCC